MPRKKVQKTEQLEQTGQTALTPDEEATPTGSKPEAIESPDGITADDFAESLLAGQETPPDTPDAPVEAPPEEMPAGMPEDPPGVESESPHEACDPSRIAGQKNIRYTERRS